MFDGHKNFQEPLMNSFGKSPLKLPTEIVRKEWTSIYRLDNETEAQALEKLLKDLDSKPADAIDRRFVKNILKLYFTKEYLAGLTEPGRKPALKILFTSFCIRCRLQKQTTLVSVEQDIQTVAALRQNFPPTDDKKELEYLTYFVVSMKELLNILPGHQNQGLFLGVCALLEGSGKVYKTGGDPSKETRRRMEMFLHLSGVVPTPKKRKITGSVDGDDGSLGSTGSKDTKLMKFETSTTVNTMDTDVTGCSKIPLEDADLDMSSILLQIKYGRSFHDEIST